MNWISSKHNMGMALNREVWQKIKKCTEVSFIHTHTEILVCIHKQCSKYLIATLSIPSLSFIKMQVVMTIFNV